MMKTFDKQVAQFEMHTKQGNVCFAKEQQLCALSHYQHAVKVSKSLWEELKRTGNMELQRYTKAVNANLVSHHNLAELYDRVGAIEMADKALKDVHLAILDALNTTHSNESIHEMLMRAATNSHRALSLLKRKIKTSKPNQTLDLCFKHFDKEHSQTLLN